MTASSHGLGAVVAQALDHGCRDIIIGVGGSASTDGGAGFLTALGATVRDQYGARIDPSGATIGTAAQLDLTGCAAEGREPGPSDGARPLPSPLGRRRRARTEN